MVLNDRTAQAGAVLVEAQRKLAGRKESARVQLIVPQELIEAAMPLVGARLGYDISLTAADPADTRRIEGRIHAKLRDRFRGNLNTEIGLFRLAQNACGVHSVEENFVVVQTVSGKSDARLVSAPGIDRPPAQGS